MPGYSTQAPQTRRTVREGLICPYFDASGLPVTSAGRLVGEAKASNQVNATKVKLRIRIGSPGLPLLGLLY